MISVAAGSRETVRMAGSLVRFWWWVKVSRYVLFGTRCSQATQNSKLSLTTRNSPQIYFAASYTAFPPTYVDSTLVFMTISAGTRMMSVSRITKSANLPAVSDPIDCS